MNEFEIVILGTLGVMGAWTAFCGVADWIARRQDKAQRRFEYDVREAYPREYRSPLWVREKRTRDKQEAVKAYVNAQYGKHRK